MSRFLSLTPAAALLAALLAIQPEAAASTLQSHQRLTQIDLKSCKRAKAHAEGGAWLCSGLHGWPVYIAEGDLRQFVSVGAQPEKRRSATQTPRAFNSIFKAKSDRALIEWRLGAGGRLAKPFAIIVRYYTSGDGKSGEILAVLKVSETDSCHIAYVDARSNREALSLARRIADERARTFDCKREPTVEGRSGPGGPL